MKRLVVLSLLCMIALGAFSQSRKDSLMRNFRVKKMTDRLLLSPEQANRFNTVYVAYMDKVHEVLKHEKGRKDMNRDEVYARAVNRIDKQIKVLEIKKDVIAQLKDFLTPEQLQCFITADAKMKAHFKGPRNSRKFENRGFDREPKMGKS